MAHGQWQIIETEKYQTPSGFASMAETLSHGSGRWCTIIAALRKQPVQNKNTCAQKITEIRTLFDLANCPAMHTKWRLRLCESRRRQRIQKLLPNAPVADSSRDFPITRTPHYGTAVCRCDHRKSQKKRYRELSNYPRIIRHLLRGNEKGKRLPEGGFEGAT
jgi:hypothetical protein